MTRASPDTRVVFMAPAVAFLTRSLPNCVPSPRNSPAGQKMFGDAHGQVVRAPASALVPPGSQARDAGRGPAPGRAMGTLPDGRPRYSGDATRQCVPITVHRRRYAGPA